LVLPWAFGSAAFVVLHSATGRVGIAAVGSLLVAAASVLFLAYSLYVPSTASLLETVAANERRLAKIVEEIRAVEKSLIAVNECLEARAVQRNGILTSIEYRAAAFLKKDWRAMRGIEWETYLREVFEMLGYQVWRTKGSGDQGVDLIVASGEKRCAIQAKGYAKTVGNGAVQEAVSGRAFYKCNCCAVVTNSRFSSSAYELAKCNDCLLIDEERIPDFVRGRISI
jgi:HJR/Mrr/RecB family endonuclease